MNHATDIELIRLHQAEMRAAADDHRLLIAGRRTGRRRHLRATPLHEISTRATPRRVRPTTEAEPCPP